jgi:nucleotide-binding universal stress UspA family protein
MVDDVLARIVCGIDGTPAATDAALQAAQVADASSQLLLVAVVDEASLAAATAGASGIVMPPAAADLGSESLEDAAQLVRGLRPGLHVETRVLDGPVLPTLLGALSDEQATLAVVGRHGHSRLAGLMLGSAMTTLLHEALCAVLVAGPLAEDGSFPRSIAVGYDGSDEAGEAVRAAARLARRTEATLDALCATGGKEVEVDRIQAALADVAPGVALSVVDEDPVHALVEPGVDLVVVGHRGLHGVKALGSVSERVAHRADCSVLVVR